MLKKSLLRSRTLHPLDGEQLARTTGGALALVLDIEVVQKGKKNPSDQSGA